MVATGHGRRLILRRRAGKRKEDLTGINDGDLAVLDTLPIA
jgi:hypothetical protein